MGVNSHDWNGYSLFITRPGSSDYVMWCNSHGTCKAKDGWQTLSDVRTKTNIKTLEGSLDKIMQVRGVSYTRKSGTQSEMSKVRTGVIAQEIELILPDLVSDEDAEGYKGVSYSKFGPILIEALKELKAEKDSEINAIKAEYDSKLASQNAQIQALTQRIEALENR